MAIMTQERNEDFLKAFRRELQLLHEQNQSPTVEKVLERVLSGDAPGYYVSYQYARRVVGDLVERGVASRFKGKVRRFSRRDMMIEIALKCVDKMERRGINLGRALTDVLAGDRASAWFMSRTYARQLYYRSLTDKKSRR